MFEDAGLTHERPKGNGNCVMTTTVAPTGQQSQMSQPAVLLVE